MPDLQKSQPLTVMVSTEVPKDGGGVAYAVHPADVPPPVSLPPCPADCWCPR